MEQRSISVIIIVVILGLLIAGYIKMGFESKENKNLSLDDENENLVDSGPGFYEENNLPDGEEIVGDPESEWDPNVDSRNIPNLDRVSKYLDDFNALLDLMDALKIELNKTNEKDETLDVRRVSLDEDKKEISFILVSSKYVYDVIINEGSGEIKYFKRQK